MQIRCWYPLIFIYLFSTLIMGRADAYRLLNYRSLIDTSTCLLVLARSTCISEGLLIYNRSLSATRHAIMMRSFRNRELVTFPIAWILLRFARMLKFLEHKARNTLCRAEVTSSSSSSSLSLSLSPISRSLSFLLAASKSGCLRATCELRKSGINAFQRALPWLFSSHRCCGSRCKTPRKSQSRAAPKRRDFIVRNARCSLFPAMLTEALTINLSPNVECNNRRTAELYQLLPTPPSLSAAIRKVSRNWGDMVMLTLPSQESLAKRILTQISSPSDVGFCGINETFISTEFSALIRCQKLANAGKRNYDWVRCQRMLINNGLWFIRR